MKSVRLTYDLRRKISDAALSDALSEIRAEMRVKAEEAIALASKVTQDTYIARYGSPRENGEHRYIFIRARRGSDETAFYINNADTGGSTFTAPMGDMSVTDEATYNALMGYGRLLDSYSSRRNILVRKLDTLLKRVTTTKRLAQVWPEGAKYIPEPEEATNPDADIRAIANDINEVLLDCGVEIEA